MFDAAFKILKAFFLFFLPVIYIAGAALLVFLLLCLGWYLYFRYHEKMVVPPSGQVYVPKPDCFVSCLLTCPGGACWTDFKEKPDTFTQKESICSVVNREPEKQ